MARRTIRIEPFGDTVEVLVVTGERDRAKIAAEHGLEDSVHHKAWVAVLHARTGGAKVVVSLPEKRYEDTIYHEALHIVCELCELHGCPIDNAGQEWLCYMQSYVVREIDKAVYTKRRGQRKASMTK